MQGTSVRDLFYFTPRMNTPTSETTIEVNGVTLNYLGSGSWGYEFEVGSITLAISGTAEEGYYIEIMFQGKSLLSSMAINTITVDEDVYEYRG